MKKLGKKICFTGVVLLVMCGFVQTAGATGKGYTAGSEGVLAASVPPPGFHWRVFNILYETDTQTDDNGKKLGIDLDLGVFAQAHRFINITDKKIFGADYGFSFIIPVVATDLEVGAMSMKQSKIGLGDLYVEPLILAWHAPRYDIALGLGFNLPTGDFSISEPASPGNGYWSSMFTLGATYFFDDQKSLSGSVLTRTLYYGEQEDSDLEPGTEFIVDFGIGKEIPVAKGFLLRPGICGYGFWQLNKDEGPTATDPRGIQYAIGGEVNLFWLPPSLFQVNLRSLVEFGAENETEGNKTVLTVTKSF